MAITSSNFYEILGVDKASDERTIKKAYFTLVRKYPPETHPEEFKKLREAYEVLSSADSRRQYDSVGQYDAGDEVSAEIAVAMKAMEESRYVDAQVLFSKLINKRPELHFARDMLGMSFLHNKEAPAAQQIFDELVTQHPTNAAYHLHRAYAYHAQKAYEKAIPSYLKAKSLDRDDVRPLASLADCYMDQKRWEDALQILDEAINLDGVVDYRDFGLFTRKLEVELERHNAPGARAVLDQLLTIVPDDAEARRHVANRLASLATPLFVQKRVDEANLLMKACAKVDPTRASGQMPPSFTVPIEVLPDEAKKWLADNNKARAPSKVGGSAYGLPIFMMLVGLGGLWFCLMALFGTDSPMPPEAVVTMGLMLIGSALLTAWSVSRTVAAARSPYGAYTIVHPMYLLQVQVDKLNGWPLVNLQDVHITHRSTNGVYTASTVELIFTRRNYSVSIYGQQASVDWANSVLARRRRMLELMYSGLLEEASEAPTIVPAALIPEDGVKPVLTPRQLALRKRGRTMYAAAAAVAALLTLVAVPINARNVEKRAFDDARFAYRNKVEAYHAYLQRYPDGRFTSEAKVAVAKLYDDAIARAKQKPPSELTAALIDVVTALKAKEQSVVRVKYTAHTAFEKLDMAKLPERISKDLVDPRPAFTAAANRSREATITTTLESAFSQVVGDGLITFAPAGAGEVDPPVTFEMTYDVGLTGSIYTSVKGKDQYGNERAGDDKKFLGVAFFWEFGVKFAADKEQKYSFEFDSEPAKNIHWTTSTYGRYAPVESPTLPYDKMAESAFEDFQHQLTKRFGAGNAGNASRASAAADDGYDDQGEDEPAPPPVAKQPAPKQPLVPAKNAKPAKK